jgi:hypothetical protein
MSPIIWAETPKKMSRVNITNGGCPRANVSIARKLPIEETE